MTDEFPPLSDESLKLSADPRYNRPHTVSMALELIEARNRLKLLDRLKIMDDWECCHAVALKDRCPYCEGDPFDEDGGAE